MLTGFNTDIEHDGVVYHVQTEDKGLESPLILSLVYAGGAILASKRSRYEDLIASGFDEEVLAQRLKRQHRLICAAINAGRLEELKRMGERPEDGSAQEAPPLTEAQQDNAIDDAGAAEAEADATSETATGDEAAIVSKRRPKDEVWVVGDVAAERAEQRRGQPDATGRESTYTVYDSRRQSPLGEVIESETGVVLTVLDEDEFRAGESCTIRVLVEDRSRNKEKPLMGVAVSVKILGTEFRPQMYSVKTERDGVAALLTTMPNFTSGRAAVLIRAVVKGQTMEVRRVIHPAE